MVIGKKIKDNNTHIDKFRYELNGITLDAMTKKDYYFILKNLFTPISNLTRINW